MDDLVLKIGVLAVAFALWIKPQTEIEAATPSPIIKTAQLELEERDKHCLAVMVYGEAESETFYGKAGVAWTALNRYDRGHYNSVCGVVLQHNQFHAFRDTSLVKAATSSSSPKNADRKEWEESVKVASLAYDGVIPDPTKGSTYFVNPKKLKGQPKWLKKLTKKVIIDNHHFYG